MINKRAICLSWNIYLGYQPELEDLLGNSFFVATFTWSVCLELGHSPVTFSLGCVMHLGLSCIFYYFARERLCFFLLHETCELTPPVGHPSAVSVEVPPLAEWWDLLDQAVHDAKYSSDVALLMYNHLRLQSALVVSSGIG